MHISLISALLTVLSDNKFLKDASVKPSRDRASSLSYNHNDIEKVVESNNHDVAIRNECNGNGYKKAEVLRVFSYFNYSSSFLSNITCMFH